MYADFDNHNPEAVNELAGKLQRPPATGQMNSGNHEISQLTQPPTAYHPGGSARPSSSRATASSGPGGGISYSSTSCNIPTTSQLPPKFLEVCVNTGEFSRTLAEITVQTSAQVVASDEELFTQIRAEYQRLRGFRANPFFLLKPATVHFVQVSMADGAAVIAVLTFPSFAWKIATASESWTSRKLYPSTIKCGPHTTNSMNLRCQRGSFCTT